jgi:hypothetical protein
VTLHTSSKEQSTISSKEQSTISSKEQSTISSKEQSTISSKEQSTSASNTQTIIICDTPRDVSDLSLSPSLSPSSTSLGKISFRFALFHSERERERERVSQVYT